MAAPPSDYYSIVISSDKNIILSFDHSGNVAGFHSTPNVPRYWQIDPHDDKSNDVALVMDLSYLSTQDKKVTATQIEPKNAPKWTLTRVGHHLYNISPAGEPEVFLELTNGASSIAGSGTAIPVQLTDTSDNSNQARDSSSRVWRFTSVEEERNPDEPDDEEN